MDQSTFAGKLPAPGSRTILRCGGDGGEPGFEVMAVNGASPGPVLLVSGGVHGDEYEGPAAIQEIYQRLDPRVLRGCWLGAPVVNEAAMRAGQRVSPIDGLDLARVFPGDPAGAGTERLAWAFGQTLMKLATHYIDLHSGGTAMRIVSLAGYKTIANSAVVDEQRRMAIAFGADLVWGTPPLLRPTLWQAEQFGIPAIYAETGGTGAWSEEARGYRNGVESVMRAIGMMEGSYPASPCRYFREAPPGQALEGYLQVDHPAPGSGLFAPECDLWDEVAEGQVIGRILDFAGTCIAAIPARRTGHLVLLRRPSFVKEQDPLAVVVEGLSSVPRPT
ncbi:MAG: succinylglutamate desuccinylase/aspartoacylase family protein [Bryobacteraceae bacterium]